MTVTRRSFVGSVASALALSVCANSFLAHARAYPIKIQFQNSDQFDDSLTKAMNEGFEAIDVQLDRVSGQKMPDRLRKWIARVQKTGGEVRFRDVTPNTRGAWWALVEIIVGIVGPYAIDAIRSVMHDPASDYHVVLVGQGTSAETTELLGVELYRRGSSSWAEARDNSKPIELKS